MNNDWLGKTVSLDCGSLGFFQGIIEVVHLEEQTITIKNVFQNGIPSKIASVTIRAQDIKDLKFLESGEKNQPIAAKSTIQVVKKRQKPVAENLASFSSPNAERRSAFSTPHRFSPRKGVADQFQNPARDNPRTPSSRRDRFSRRDEDCFGDEIYEQDFTKDFDFEKNLALFDKQLVFEEISASNQPDVVRLVDINRRKKPAEPIRDATEPKYRNDQNVIDTVPVNYRQIKVGNGLDLDEYVTDTGLVVPAIDFALRERLMSAAEARGFSRERITELMARSCTELSMQLLGGVRRLTPTNSHQYPLAVLLCGPGKTGSYGLATARHLAAQGIRTVAFLPEMSVYPSIVASELNLYKLCCKGGSTKVSSMITNITELPKSPVDLIVMAIDDHDMYGQEMKQDWHKNIIKWVEACRAPVLAIDPVPSSRAAALAKASVLPGLPIWHPHNTAGSIYLVNLALPVKIFKDVGITFSSPFGAKTFIALHSAE